MPTLALPFPISFSWHMVTWSRKRARRCTCQKFSGLRCVHRFVVTAYKHEPMSCCRSETKIEVWTTKVVITRMFLKTKCMIASERWHPATGSHTRGSFRPFHVSLPRPCVAKKCWHYLKGTLQGRIDVLPSNLPAIITNQSGTIEDERDFWIRLGTMT